MTNNPQGACASDDLPECPGEGQGCAVPEKLARWTAVLLSRATHLCRANFERRIADLEIRAKHYGILLLLEDGPLMQSEICRNLWVDRSTMVALIDDLERLKLVERVRHPRDRRAYAVTLTDAGSRVAEQATQAAYASEAAVFEALTGAERDSLRELLAKLLNGTHGAQDCASTKEETANNDRTG